MRGPSASENRSGIQPHIGKMAVNPMSIAKMRANHITPTIRAKAKYILPNLFARLLNHKSREKFIPMIIATRKARSKRVIWNRYGFNSLYQISSCFKSIKLLKDNRLISKSICRCIKTEGYITAIEFFVLRRRPYN